MFKRLLNIESDQSAFLFGPRGVGKTVWLEHTFPDALYFDLLDDRVYSDFLGNPTILESRIPDNFNNWVILDEIQRIPDLLNEVHRLIAHKNIKFILTGSSARKLRRKGVNLLAGRALTYHMHPLTISELGNVFNLAQTLKYGLLPQAITLQNPEKYLQSYMQTYLREEVLQESLVRNLNLFSKFLEIASLSQGEILSYSTIAREVGISRYSISNFFDILEDLLVGFRLPVFRKRAKRNIISHPKFYYFDVGVYQTIRPKGIIDSPSEIEGPALETLFLQESKAINDYFDLNYDFFYWRTQNKQEVDFVLYGENGFHAFEIKRKTSLQSKDFSGLKLFGEDYPQANLYMLYGGNRAYYENNIKVIPYGQAIKDILSLISKRS